MWFHFYVPIDALTLLTQTLCQCASGHHYVLLDLYHRSSQFQLEEYKRDLLCPPCSVHQKRVGLLAPSGNCKGFSGMFQVGPSQWRAARLHLITVVASVHLLDLSGFGVLQNLLSAGREILVEAALISRMQAGATERKFP